MRTLFGMQSKEYKVRMKRVYIDDGFISKWKNCANDIDIERSYIDFFLHLLPFVSILLDIQFIYNTHIHTFVSTALNV